MKKCPQCGLINLDSASICDCAFPLDDPNVRHDQVHAEMMRRHSRGMLLGLLSFALPFVVVLGFMLVAQPMPEAMARLMRTLLWLSWIIGTLLVVRHGHIWARLRMAAASRELPIAKLRQ